MKKQFVKGVAWLAILALLATSLAIFAGCGVKKDAKVSRVNISFWGAFENSDEIQEIISAFLKQSGHKKWTIDYKKIPMERNEPMDSSEYDNTYEELLFQEIASGQGPDIFMMHNTWFDKHADKLAVLYDSEEDVDAMENSYVPMMSEDLVVDGAVLGMPAYTDSLALYYNPKYFRNTPTGKPATTWGKFIQEIPDVEINNGDESVSAIALGTSNNISRASDIVLNFALQSGYEEDEETLLFDIGNLSVNPLEFYTQFATAGKSAFSWSEDRDYFVNEFINGNVASIVGYSYLEKEIIAKSDSRFDFEIAPLPQINLRNPTVIANYWAPAISNISENQEASFEFLEYLAEKLPLVTGRPSAYLDEIEEADDVFSKQGKIAKTFPIWSDVRYERKINKAISDVVSKKSYMKMALMELSEEINNYIKDLKNVRGL